MASTPGPYRRSACATGLITDEQEDDTLSIVASESLFGPPLIPRGRWRFALSLSFRGRLSGVLGGRSKRSRALPSAVRQAVQLAVSQLGLTTPPTEAPPSTAFFRHEQRPPFSVPPSESFLSELRTFWADPKVGLHFPQDCRALSAMVRAEEQGLGRMPPVDPNVASLIVTPEEALRREARCPLTQCRLTDELITRSYDTAARVARLGNSFPPYPGPRWISSRHRLSDPHEA